MYVRTVLYVQYLIFLKTRKISEDLPIVTEYGRCTAQGRSGPGQVRIAGRLELDRTHIHRGSVVKSWPKFCKVRDCGVCRARRSRGGLFPLAYFAFKGDWPEFAKIWNSDRNSQNFGFWPVLRTRNRVCKCHPIGSAEKSPSVFGFYYTIYYTIFPGSLALYGNLSPS